MKIALFIAFFFICGTCMAQKPLPEDSVDFYLNKIDNYAVVFGHAYSFSASLNNNAKILYDRADKYIIDKLMDSLKSKSKVLACHVLLTKLLEAGENGFYYTTEDLTDSILVSYKYNGLTWKDMYDKINLITEIRIDWADMKAVQSYWLLKKESPLYRLRTGQ